MTAPTSHKILDEIDTIDEKERKVDIINKMSHIKNKLSAGLSDKMKFYNNLENAKDHIGNLSVGRTIKHVKVVSINDDPLNL